MKLNDMNIRTRVNLTMAVLITLVFVALGIVIYKSQKATIIKETDERMLSHLNDLYLLLNNHVNLKQEKVNVSINFAHSIFYDSGELLITEDKIKVSGTNQISNLKKDYLIDEWLINGKPVYGNFEIVDLIKANSVETATIFQKIEDGYLRISTNVMKKDGERAVGTFIPNSSEVIKTIEMGKTYYGRAFVVDDWYLTAYEPIVKEGNVIGILYVGVKESDYNFLKHALSSKTYFTSGYPFIIDNSGNFIIHPTQEGKNAADATFFKQIIDSKSNEYNSRYLWPENNEGKWKQQFFKYFEPYESYICVSLYEDEMYASLRQLLLFVVLGVAISLLLTFAGISLLLRPVIGGVVKIAELSKEISQGNLNVSIDIESKDELGQTAGSLRMMVNNLSNIVRSITNSSNQIAEGSQHISISSQQLSHSASEQASSVEEISSTVEEFSSIVDKNNDNAKMTEEIALTVKSGINEINDHSQSAMVANQKISEKINIINDIAFQTNILALNAAVEAARAGEHGRGFAVVASEVRKLAERSKVAADEIVYLAGDSLRMSEIAGNRLSELLPEIEKTVAYVQEISISSIEQSGGAGQINESIQQLNIVSQNNAASSEELAVSSESMKELADKLKEIVSFFKLERQTDFKKSMNSKMSKKDSTQISKAATKGTNLKMPKLVEEVADSEFEAF